MQCPIPDVQHPTPNVPPRTRLLTTEFCSIPPWFGGEPRETLDTWTGAATLVLRMDGEEGT